MMDFAAVFIDGGYVDAVLRDHFRFARINYQTLSDNLCSPYERWSTFYFHCPPWQDSPSSPEQRSRKSQMDKFFYSLQRLDRFEVRLGKLVMRGDGPHQKGVDIRIAIDMVRLAASNRIVKAILVSGDSDLVPAVKAVQDLNVLVELVYHPSSIGDDLYQSARDRTIIDRNMIDSCRR
jgi:uncharacterized LabA/DUF88 family protein